MLWTYITMHTSFVREIIWPSIQIHLHGIRRQETWSQHKDTGDQVRKAKENHRHGLTKLEWLSWGPGSYFNILFSCKLVFPLGQKQSQRNKSAQHWLIRQLATKYIRYKGPRCFLIQSNTKHIGVRKENNNYIWPSSYKNILILRLPRYTVLPSTTYSFFLH